MRIRMLCICLLAAMPIGAGQGQSPTKPDGIYLSVLPVLGKAMIGDNRIDTTLMVEGSPMTQYVAIERLDERFDVDLIDVALLAESHAGEVQVNVAVIKNGRQTFMNGGQGRQVVFHYTAWGTPYVAIFNRR